MYNKNKFQSKTSMGGDSQLANSFIGKSPHGYNKTGLYPDICFYKVE